MTMNRSADYDLLISAAGVTRWGTTAEAPRRESHRLTCVAGRRGSQYRLDASQQSDGSDTAGIGALRGHHHHSVALLKIRERAGRQTINNLLEVTASAAWRAVPRCTSTARS